MYSVKIFYDRKGGTLTVWFGDPRTEYVSEETGNEVILMKNKEGEVIGFEKLHFSVPVDEPLQVDFQAIG